jgi:hypothetical protein
MPSYSQKARLVAASAYILHSKDMKAAKAYFREHAPKSALQLKRVDLFITKWGIKFDLKGNVKDGHRSGRPRKLRPKQLKTCLTAFKAGMKVGGQQKKFTSIREGVAHSAVLRNACNEHSIQPRNLLRMLTDADKTLKKVSRIVRPLFTNAQKLQRKELATTLYEKPRSYFNRIFFIDAKKIVVQPPSSIKVWVDTTAPSLVLTDPRASKGKKGVVLNFYACVNAMEGPVSLVFTTGSTGIKGFNNQVYKVSGNGTPPQQHYTMP